MVGAGFDARGGVFGLIGGRVGKVGGGVEGGGGGGTEGWGRRNSEEGNEMGARVWLEDGREGDKQ